MKKGELTVAQGKVLNEELKHDLHKKGEEVTDTLSRKGYLTVQTVLNSLETMDKDERPRCAASWKKWRNRMKSRNRETPKPGTGTSRTKPEGRRARHRLREMMGVLLRHDLGKGLTPVKLRLILEELGPTFVKFGQILSMRQDILPKAFCDELMKLRAAVKPMTWDEVERAVREEYGKGPEEVFRSFDREPWAPASIAQVHRALLPRGNRWWSSSSGPISGRLWSRTCGCSIRPPA